MMNCEKSSFTLGCSGNPRSIMNEHRFFFASEDPAPNPDEAGKIYLF